MIETIMIISLLPDFELQQPLRWQAPSQARGTLRRLH